MLITPEMPFGKLHVKEACEVSPGSYKKIPCVCDCGKEKYISIRYIISGHTKSCGRCNEISAEEMKTWKPYKLRMKYPKDILKGSNKKEWWLCDCENEKLIKIDDVISGNTKSCGECNEIPAEEMEKKRGKLQMKYPHNVFPSSTKLEWWLCDCGNETLASVHNVISGHTKSCGKCNLKTVEEMKTWKPYKLRMKYPKDIMPGSSEKEWWLCDCGGECFSSINHVLSGHAKSCGKCNIISAEKIAKTKYGKLRMKEPRDTEPWSPKEETWICDCGNELIAQSRYIIQGDVKSCGKCKNSIEDWYASNKDYIKSLKCPINQDQLRGGMILLETITSMLKPFKALCSACNSEYHPRFAGVKNGISLTCGCISNNKISHANKEIAEFIRLSGLEVEMEFKVNKLSYDIFIPKANLVLEFNGLRWHSMRNAKEKDLKKYNNAISNGYDYLMIFEDEWKFNKVKVKLLISNRLNMNKLTIDNSKTSIKQIEFHEANLFHEQFHHYGKCDHEISYGAFYENNLILCVSFSKIMNDLSIIRITDNQKYVINDILIRLLNYAISVTDSKLITGFSDNRLNEEKLYRESSFKLDREIQPDYFLTKGNRRYDKLSLNKIKNDNSDKSVVIDLEKLKENRKIWDLGKKRWTYDVANPTS
jgi:very-short-patch-repair endonuclease